MAHELIENWRTQRFSEPPFIFLGDDTPGLKRVIAKSYEELVQNRDYPALAGKFHVGLLPVPFIGDLENADIFIGLINPGLDAAPDYYAEETRADFCDMLRLTLRQELASATYPFFLLDPKWHWTGASRWWRQILAEIIRGLMKARECSYVDAITILAQRLAALEFVPYHSSNSSCIPGATRPLASSRLMKSFVNEVVVPKAKRGDALLLITRGKEKWGITAGRNVVVYEPSQARSASLSLSSSGGQTILDRLSRN